MKKILNSFIVFVLIFISCSKNTDVPANANQVADSLTLLKSTTWQLDSIMTEYHGVSHTGVNDDDSAYQRMIFKDSVYTIHVDTYGLTTEYSAGYKYQSPNLIYQFTPGDPINPDDYLTIKALTQKNFAYEYILRLSDNDFEKFTSYYHAVK